MVSILLSQNSPYVAESMFPGAAARRAAIRTQDYTGNYGKAIPLSQGLRRISGVPIWAGGVTDGDVIQANFSSDGFTTPNGIGGPNVNVYTRKLNRSFAVAFGYNLAPLDEIDLPKVRRVWVDGTLVYANGTAVQPIFFDQAAGVYAPSFGRVDTYDGSLYPQPAGAPIVAWRNTQAIQATIDFSFYAGTEEQLPDALIAADKGAYAPAYRGMIYMVIKNLPVGTATDTLQLGTAENGTPAWGSNRDVIINNVLPKIDVELVDGTNVSQIAHDFEQLPESTSFPFANEILMSNWKTRQIAVVDVDDNIQIFDLDAKAATQVIPLIKLHPDNTFGNSHNFTDWDTVNNVFYAHLRSSPGGTAYPIAACDMTGQIYNAPYGNNSNLGFYDSDGNNALVTGNAVVDIPEMWIGAIGHYICNGSLGTVLCGTGYPAVAFVLMPSNNGQSWPTSFPVSALSSFDTTFNTCQALPLVDVSLERAAPSYQDAAFVVAHGSKVSIVYVTVTTVSGVNLGKITGVEEIYAAPDTGMQCSALVMSDRNILILVYRSLTAESDKVARINISYDNAPDYTVAPGWKGYFPHASATVYEVDSSSSLDVPGSDGLKFSNTVNGQLLYRDTKLISTDDGSVTVLSGSGLDLGSGLDTWDDVTKTNFGHGSTGTGLDNMRYKELGTALSGDIGLLRDYLKWFGLRAGYIEAKIDIDTKIKDQVVGSIVVTSMDMAKLFDDLGKVYGFIWFVSSGVLKFVKNNQAPIKATQTLTITAQPSNGSTVTIGSFVYTFQLIPAAPFDVKIDGTAKETTLINLMRAINASGEDGYEYFSVTTAHTDVVASCPTDTTLLVTARVGGSAGNSIASTKTGTGISWGGTTLTGGDVTPTASINLTTENMMCVQGGPVGEGAALVTTFPAPQNVAEAAQISYYNLDADYAPSVQLFAPDDGSDASGLRNVLTYDTTFVMSGAEAYGRVTKLALAATSTEVTQEFQLPQQFLLAEPSDIASVTIGTYNYIVRLDEVTFNADYTISVTGQNYSFRDDVPVSYYIPQSRPEQTINGPGDGFAVVIDGPLIDPLLGSTAGVFTVYSGIKTYGQVGWRSAQMAYKDSSHEISPLFVAALDVPYGVSGTVLATTSTPFLTDDTTVLRVIAKSMGASDLASATAEQFYNNENLLIIGKPGRWEYIAFKTVTAVNTKVFEFTGLARGRRGTDANVGTHEANDEVYLVRSVATGFAAYLNPQAQEVALVGEDGEYTVLGLPATRPVAPVTVTFAGESLKPFSPCGLAAELQVGNDIDLTWNRRDRLQADFITDEPPLSETTELYDLEILSAGVVVRTVSSLAVPSYTYTSANQTTDGFSPPLASLEVRVYQKGELGRGYPKQETINVE